MESKMYMVFVEGEEPKQYDSKSEAVAEVGVLSAKLDKEVSVFKQILCVKPKDTNERIDSYEAALEYLGRENNTGIYCPPDKHAKAIVAMYKLVTIAEAWNKADSFVPDFANCNQAKWFPWLAYSRASAGFVFSHSTNAPSPAYAHIGSRLCFKDERRAEQFGKQFIELWNDFLMP